MTITLYLNKITLHRDLQTLDAIFKASKLELIEPMNKYLHPLDISSEPFVRNNVQIQVSVEEFAIIGVFSKNI